VLIVSNDDYTVSEENEMLTSDWFVLFLFLL